MFKTCYLHIGTQKTGSTSIQQTLFSHRDRLAEHGICYPAFGGRNHAPLAAEARPNSERARMLRELAEKKGWPNDTLADARTAYLDEFQAAVAAAPGETLVISSEFFVVIRRRQFQWLIDYLGQFAERIVIVCYVRHPAAAQLSALAYRVKRGRERFADLEPDGEIVDYAQRLAELWPVIGAHEHVLRPFDRSELHQGDVVKDFLKIVGAPDELIAALPVEDTNVSLSHEALLITDAVHAMVQRNELPAQKVRAIVDELTSVRGAKFAYPAEVNARIMEAARPIAARLESEFGVAVPEPRLPEPGTLWSEETLGDIAGILARHVGKKADLARARQPQGRGRGQNAGARRDAAASDGKGGARRGAGAGAGRRRRAAQPEPE